MLTQKHYCNLLRERPKFRSINSAKFDIVKRAEVLLFQITDGWPSSTFIENNYFSIYVRKGHCYEERLPTFDIAQIAVLKKSFQGRGHGTNLIMMLHSVHPFQRTVLECVHYLNLARWCKNHEWKQYTESPSFYLDK